MHKSGMGTSLLDNLTDSCFFANVFFAKKINFKAVVTSDFFSVCADFLSQRIGPLCEVEYANSFHCEKGTHSLSIANSRHGAIEYDAVKAGYDTFDFTVVLFDKVLYYSDSPYQSFN